jgi:hypothetical protein
LKIRRRPHPTHPATGPAAQRSRGAPGVASPRNPTGVRMRRTGTQLFNHGGEDITPRAPRTEEPSP